MLHHIPHLLLPCSSIACDCEFDLTGSVLCNGQSTLYQREEYNTAGLRNPYGRCHILAEEELLYGRLLRVVASYDEAQFFMDQLQP